MVNATHCRGYCAILFFFFQNFYFFLLLKNIISLMRFPIELHQNKGGISFWMTLYSLRESWNAKFAFREKAFGHYFNIKYFPSCKRFEAHRTIIIAWQLTKTLSFEAENTIAVSFVSNLTNRVIGGWRFHQKAYIFIFYAQSLFVVQKIFLPTTSI